MYLIFVVWFRILSGMRMPNAEQGELPEAKIVGYLLSMSHRAGRGKALFFTAYGFSTEKWDELAVALRRHALDNEVTACEDTTFGTRYVIDGDLLAPAGRVLRVRAVWFIDNGSEIPRFVTAYAGKRRYK